MVVACPAKISAIKWKYLNGYLNYAVLGDLVLNYTKVITLDPPHSPFREKLLECCNKHCCRAMSDLHSFWLGPGFICVKQFRVYARNINDGDTLCDPSHTGSVVTIKGSCEATGPASQIGEGSHGPQIWLVRQERDCGKGELHSWALPMTLVLKVLMLPGYQSCFISSSGCWFHECFHL